MVHDQRPRFTVLAELLLFVLLLGGVGAGCSSIGPKKLVSSHTAYNDAVQLTVSREVLANIVRARYSDPMLFIRVSSINAQFSVGLGGTAGVGGVGQAGSAGSVGGSVSYSDSPTITYVPQSDAGFYKSMMSPFSVAEAVGFGLQFRFLELDRELEALSVRLAFGSINGADDFSEGRFNEVYLARVGAIVRLIELGATYRQVPEWDLDAVSISRDRVTAEDMVSAREVGMQFVEDEEGADLRLARFRIGLALALPDPEDPRVIAALRELGAEPGATHYVFRSPDQAVPGRPDPYAIWVTPRSMLDLLNLAARSVAVPPAHAGVSTWIEPWPLEVGRAETVGIRCSEEEPLAPYRIEHRGYWFYIDDEDLASKLFFEALVASFTSRVGVLEAGDQGPTMVLPIGGG